MRIAGIGCRKGVTAAEVLVAVEAACSALLPSPQGGEGTVALDALATAAFKADEPGIAAAAKALDLSLIGISEHDLKRVSSRCVTHSNASLAATGVTSVSEAAALAAAGEGSRLLGPRIVSGNVTCAIAQSRNEA